MKKLTAWVLLAAIYLGFVAPASLVANGQVIGKTMDEKLKNTPNGLGFRLSEGTEGAEKRVKQPLASTDPLSSGDVSSLLKRLPEIKTVPDDSQDFARRIGTLPAPKQEDLFR